MSYTGYNYDSYSSSLLDTIKFTKNNYMSDIARGIDRLKNNIKVGFYLISLKEQKEQYNLMITKSKI